MLSFEYSVRTSNGKDGKIIITIFPDKRNAVMLQITGVLQLKPTIIEGLDGIGAVCMAVFALREYFKRMEESGHHLLFDHLTLPLAVTSIEPDLAIDPDSKIYETWNTTFDKE